MDEIKLVELLSSFQGEGPNTGRRCLILRFKTCNRICKWCDTLKKMVTIPEKIYSINEIQTIVTNEQCGLLITGGEPTFNSPHNNNLDQTIAILNYLRYSYADVETNGLDLKKLTTNTYKTKNVNFIFSPKIFSEKDLDYSLDRLPLVKSDNRIYLKVVCDLDHVNLLKNFLKEVNNYDLNERTYLMPKGTSFNEIMSSFKDIMRLVTEYKLNFSSREHIIYGFE